jgi:hypothetical protein
MTAPNTSEPPSQPTLNVGMSIFYRMRGSEKIYHRTVDAMSANRRCIQVKDEARPEPIWLDVSKIEIIDN